jgi:hypothetical protein
MLCVNCLQRVISSGYYPGWPVISWETSSSGGRKIKAETLMEPAAFSGVPLDALLPATDMPLPFWVVIPAALRRRRGLRTGDRVLLAAAPDHGGP